MDVAPDVIVKWQDGSKNCVSTKDIKSAKKGQNNVNRVGAKIKMLYKNKWYYGTVVVTEVDSQHNQVPNQSQQSSNAANFSEFSSDDDQPLSNLKTNLDETASNKEDPFYDDEDSRDPDFVLPSNQPRKLSVSSDATVCADDVIFNENLVLNKSIDLHHNTLQLYNEGIEATLGSYQNQTCEVVGCTEEVFSACSRCLVLQCWNHFKNDASCEQHFQCGPTSPSILTTQNDITKGLNLRIDNDKIYLRETETRNECSDTAILQHMEIDQLSPMTASSENHQKQICEVVGCQKEVFSSCFRCLILQCWDHFVNDDFSCELHVRRDIQSPNITTTITSKAPEDYEMEGDPRELEMTYRKKINQKKQNKLQKDQGKEYSTQVKKTKMPAKKLGPLCNLSYCQHLKRDCYKFDEESRQIIFEDYWSQGDIQRQREFVARHVEKTETLRKTAGVNSRRKLTFKYYLTLNGVRVNVCRYLFLNTLSITERVLRTAVQKVSESGVVIKDKRGGRPQSKQELDARSRDLCVKHIDRYPRVESHYCREGSTREYLHSDLTVKKMYRMFIRSLEGNPLKPSFSTYKRVFKGKNLSFHRPKKDQCSLCLTYYNGTEEVKAKLQEKFQKHQFDKLTFRNTRKMCLNQAKENPGVVQCVTFDLQQVIQIPITNENAVFYKRRLSTFNLTVYDLGTRDCCCFTWYEAVSKRGASEISTALNIFLRESDRKGFKRIYLFADGCGGQNRNSIVAAALIYILTNSLNIEEITLRFSIPNHGQSAGDSAHSAISYAVKKAGDVFIPAQLIPIMRLARIDQPYRVFSLLHTDFLDFKKMSTDIQLLSLRKDDTGAHVNWTEMTEFCVKKSDPIKFFFKTSHDQESYRSLTLKRQKMFLLYAEIRPLNEYPPKIATEKYEDLMSLTKGDTAVIRHPDYVEFYKSLPH